MALGACDGGCGDPARFMISDTSDGQTKALCPECAGGWGLALALTVLPGEVFAQALDQFARENGLEPAQAPPDPAAEPAAEPKRRRRRAPAEPAASHPTEVRDDWEREGNPGPEGIAEGVTD